MLENSGLLIYSFICKYFISKKPDVMVVVAAVELVDVAVLATAMIIGIDET